MSVRTSLFIFALAATGLSVAHAQNTSTWVGSEIGYVPEQHAYARVDGQWVCIDNIAHNAKPEAVKSDAEQRLFLQLFPA